MAESLVADLLYSRRDLHRSQIVAIIKSIFTDGSHVAITRHGVIRDRTVSRHPHQGEIGGRAFSPEKNTVTAIVPGVFRVGNDLLQSGNVKKILRHADNARSEHQRGQIFTTGKSIAGHRDRRISVREMNGCQSGSTVGDVVIY